MNKITKFIEGIVAIIKNPWLLNLVIATNKNWRKKFQNKHVNSNSLPQIPFEKLLGNQEIKIPNFTFLDGTGWPTDLALLRGIAKKYNCKSYFEIGTWRGESAANMAEIVAEVDTFNLSDDEILSMGFGEDFKNQIGFSSKNIKNIRHLKGNSHNFDFGSLQKKYDLIFIDGDHSYHGVLNDTKKVFANLIHENSIVVWHDFAFNPEMPRFEVYKAIVDGIPKQFQNRIFHVSHTLSAVYIPKIFGDFETLSSNKEYELPRINFEIELKIKKI